MIALVAVERNPDAYRGKVLADPSCRACGKPGSEAHHLVRRGAPHFGEDVPENIVCLCSDCHGDFHRGGDWRTIGKAIGAALEQDERLYIFERANTSYAALYYNLTLS